MDSVLPEFQAFLLEQGLVPENQASYYAGWVGRFLDLVEQSSQESLDILKLRFSDQLARSRRVQDWQVEQARNALELYYGQFQTEQGRTAGEVELESVDRIREVLDRCRELIRIKHYSYSTEQTYLAWIERFYEYCRVTDPMAVTGVEVSRFLSHLALKRQVASSTQNQAFNALLFLFRNVLHVDLGDMEKTVRAKRGPRLPVVLSVKEVQDLFVVLKGRDSLIVRLLYGTGMRLMEVARLRVQDIDFDGNAMFVRAAKGDKDRVTLLPESLKEALRGQLLKVKELHDKDLNSGYGEVYMPYALERKYPGACKELRWQYVFPSARLSVDPRSGKVRRHHISEKAIQNIVQAAARDAGIVKHVTVHTLRHSFATHMLMNGVNIREVQELLGHKNVETTMVYTHVMRNLANAPRSPLDMLYEQKSEGL